MSNILSHPQETKFHIIGIILVSRRYVSKKSKIDINKLLKFCWRISTAFTAIKIIISYSGTLNLSQIL